MELTKFEMPQGNACSKCGDKLPKDADVFAASWDDVLAGRGICSKCAEPLKSKQTTTRKTK